MKCCICKKEIKSIDNYRTLTTEKRKPEEGVNICWSCCEERLVMLSSGNFQGPSTEGEV